MKINRRLLLISMIISLILTVLSYIVIDVPVLCSDEGYDYVYDPLAEGCGGSPRYFLGFHLAFIGPIVYVIVCFVVLTVVFYILINRSKKKRM